MHFIVSTAVSGIGWITLIDNAYLIVVSNNVGLYTTDSLIFMCVYLAYLLLASFMVLNRNVRSLADDY